ncbi:hypothetical protein SAMN05428950_1011557 [Sphingomonas sp. OV641]|uniref:hypothetical protein n=1 Tax=Sphingomonas sp. OV641 TaxID=1881068 RepID=UPI0008D69850|nr:hypothetical protein [Sphingomonas sp. OV641]SEJ23850.1 hypothetical protein SAMN05428950_1011557 [Sphingomonas sp. OV641]
MKRALSSAPQSGAAATRVADAGILRPVLVAWAIAAIIFVMIGAKDILILRFNDPDDAMRLLEVRDWLAGQSWWDVAQHRFNHGAFPMHWSRLVDLPLAAMLVATTPLLGEPVAIRLTVTVVPLLTLLATMLLLAQITRRTAGFEAARYAALITPLTLPLMIQLRPLRIDHHGWQIVLTLGAILCLLRRPTWRNGALAGMALAALLTISIEGLPIAVSIAGVAAAAWAWQPERKPFLLALMWSLAGGAVLLHLLTRGPGFFATACDAMSPAWLVTLSFAALSTTIAMVAGRSALIFRLAALAAAGGLTGAVLFLYAPQCLAGPFATLPPLAYEFWYLNVLEGRPVWEQPFYQAFVTMAVPVVGVVATAAGLGKADDECRPRWAILLVLLVAATAVTVFVDRAGATANALAVPGVAAMLLALLIRARQLSNVGLQVVATAAALIIASPGYLAIAGLAWSRSSDPAWQEISRLRDAGQTCAQISDIRPVAELPPSLLFSPVDIGPEIVSTTHHRAIGAGYHRSPEPMTLIIRTFTGTPSQARQIIFASKADYLVVCPGLGELDHYRERFPDGLWARLERGERFAWLEPVVVRGPAQAWRVIRPLPLATPRP